MLVMHLGLLLVLSVGLIERTGTRYLHWLILYAAMVVLVFAVSKRLLPTREDLVTRPRLKVDVLVKAVLLLLPPFAIFHWSRFGGPPAWLAYRAADELATSALRDAPKHEPWVWINYTGLLFISAILPFSIAAAYHVRHRAFPWLVAMSTIYAVSLLPRSYVVVIFLPLFVLLLVRRKFLHVAALGSFCLACVMGLAWLGDPDKLRHGSDTRTTLPADEGIEQRGVVGDALWHIARRVFVTPGWTVADWFTHIPHDIPWCEGAAVRPIALITGKPYVDVATRIYELEYPEEVQRGIHGTVPSAAFMYDYANYGGWGLLLSAVIIGLSFALVQRFSGMTGQWAWCFGLYPALALAATAYTTVLVTHGWLATIVLFILVRPDLSPQRSS